MSTQPTELRQDARAILNSTTSLQHKNKDTLNSTNDDTTVSVAEAFALLCGDSSSSSSSSSEDEDEDESANGNEAEDIGQAKISKESTHVAYYKSLFPERYGVIKPSDRASANPTALVTMEDQYVSDLLAAAFESAQPRWEVHRAHDRDRNGDRDGDLAHGGEAAVAYLIHWGEYEDIDWFGDHQASLVSCFYTRKGLIRKALLAQTMTKLCKKTEGKIQPMPESFVLQLQVDQGSVHKLTRKEEEEVSSLLESIGFDVASCQGCNYGNRWILKPSMTNQGKGIRLVHSWESLLVALAETDEIERAGGLVLQRYIEPLLLGGKKFHLRVFVLVVGDCAVFVHRQFLAIVSLEMYDMQDFTQTQAHLTNICHQKIRSKEDQEQCMRLFEEVAKELVETGVCASNEDAEVKMKKVEQDVLELTKEAMEAVTKELTFQARPNGFELFGFDYLVEENWRVWLLEANAEPDLKMAGDRLQWVIDDMLREALQIVIDSHEYLHLQLSHSSQREPRFTKVSQRAG